MTIKSVLTALMLAVGCVICSSATAQAHVLITDTSGNTGAILHINPGDDPIAGQPSTLFFDVQNKDNLKQNYAVSLTVRDSHGSESTVPAVVTANTASATFTFPRQGLYTLTLRATPTKPGGQALQFEHTQRVSRGTMGTAAPAAVQYEWAYTGTVVNLCGVAVLVIVAFNRRKNIAAYTRDKSPKKKGTK